VIENLETDRTAQNRGSGYSLVGVPSFAQRVGSSESASSGRLKIAQRFIAGDRPAFETKSVKRTAEGVKGSIAIIQPSASRTTNPLALFPSSELLGYYHSSALRTFLGKVVGPGKH
jgi:CTP:molybdopterin cytidylyltransferase MocA